MLECSLHLQPPPKPWNVPDEMSVSSEFRIAFVVPRSGPPGLYGPSSRSCAELAVEHLNASGGINGARVSLVLVDGAQRPQLVAESVGALIDAGAISAIVGTHHSDVRRALIDLVDDRIPYVYAANYEGDADTDRVLTVGLTAAQQLRSSVEWLAGYRGVRNWFFVGSDYVWPRGMLAELERSLVSQGLDLSGADFVPFGEANYSPLLNAIQQTRPDAICAALVGADAVAFSRQFVRRGLDSSIIRFLPLFEENSLLALGKSVGAGVFTAGCFFAGMDAEQSGNFQAQYDARFGSQAPQLNGFAVACYDAVMLLAAIGTGAGTGASASTENNITFRSALGHGRLDRGHVVRDVLLAEAVDGRFAVRACFDRVGSDGIQVPLASAS